MTLLMVEWNMGNCLEGPPLQKEKKISFKMLNKLGRSPMLLHAPQSCP